jgi:hypothetical protein
MLKNAKSEAPNAFPAKLGPPNAGKSMKTKIFIALSFLLLLALFDKSSRLHKAMRAQTLSVEAKTEKTKPECSVDLPECKVDTRHYKKIPGCAPKCLQQEDSDEAANNCSQPEPQTENKDIQFNLPANNSTLPGLADSVCKKTRCPEKVKTIVIV